MRGRGPPWRGCTGSLWRGTLRRRGRRGWAYSGGGAGRAGRAATTGAGRSTSRSTLPRDASKSRPWAAPTAHGSMPATSCASQSGSLPRSPSRATMNSATDSWLTAKARVR